MGASCAEQENTVADNVLEANRQEHDRFNVNVEAEPVYWTREFQCSREQLAMAIQQLGRRVPDLRRVLGPNPHHEAP
jgi:hypothetical protein